MAAALQAQIDKQHAFLAKHTHSLSLTAQVNSISGHADTSVNASTGAFVFCDLIIIVLSTIYMAWRIYYKKKYLTPGYIKEYGESNRPEAQKQDEDGDKIDKEIQLADTEANLKTRSANKNDKQRGARDLNINKK